MKINSKGIVSMSEAIRDFSNVARIVDENGTAVILKNDVPRYLIVAFSQADKEQSADSEDVMTISKRLIEKTDALTSCLLSKLLTPNMAEPDLRTSALSRLNWREAPSTTSVWIHTICSMAYAHDGRDR